MTTAAVGFTTEPPDSVSKGGGTPTKVTKKAKTTSIDGLNGQDTTAVEKRSTEKGESVRKALSFKDKLLGRQEESTDDMEDDAFVSDESDDEGEDDLECPTVRIPIH
ncbi:hypothetical protein LINPERHAP2_LOCUS34257 [Linum perenne]